MSVSKEDLEDLTNIQLKEIVKKTVNKLGLKVQGKNKTELVNALDGINKGNKFYGKKLLSLDDSGHIKIPKRKIREGVKEAKRKKAIDKRKKILDLQIGESQEKIKAGEKRLEGMKKTIKLLQAKEKYNKVLQNAKNNFRGKSRAELDEMRKEIQNAKKEYENELKKI